MMGQPVSLIEALRHRALHRHAAAVGGAQPLEVDLAEVGVVEQRVVERVHRRQHVELVLARAP